MKKFLTLLVIVLLGVIAKAQSPADTDKSPSKPPVDTSEVFVALEKPATFPGGEKKFKKYIQKNSKYPIATEDDPSLRVIFNVIVRRDGSLTNIKILRGANPELDAEAIRLVKASAPWIPGEQRGYKVNQEATSIISFLKQ